ncbi:zinc ribbon domain-containing protein [Halosolutus amylolyticus]|uniref:Zinc ribbon domain-containing protein n=1 Tax=Halosolutus amylolyticus TaxID=2932267 RepID=A0ABD5PQF2_9EURY|nr:zinc ribbon domain-containing protein [Halosolutus amylolyticus]
MARYEFTCPDCTAQLEFDDRQRSVAIRSGCPLCGRPIADTDFATREGGSA